MAESHIIDDSVLHEIEEDRRQAATMAGHAQARAAAARIDADEAERRVRGLSVVLEFSAARVGMTFEQATAEAKAEVARLEVAAAEADKELERAKEHVRDLQGWQRIQQQLAEASQAQPDAPDHG